MCGGQKAKIEKLDENKRRTHKCCLFVCKEIMSQVGPLQVPHRPHHFHYISVFYLLSLFLYIITLSKWCHEKKKQLSGGFRQLDVFRKILNFLTLDGGMPGYVLPAPICGGYIWTKLQDHIQSIVGGRCYQSTVGNLVCLLAGKCLVN